MGSKIQCLLVGGPFDGRVIDSADRVSEINTPRRDGGQFCYMIHRVLVGDRIYRVGLFDESSAKKLPIAYMVAAAGISPEPTRTIRGDNRGDGETIRVD